MNKDSGSNFGTDDKLSNSFASTQHETIVNLRCESIV